MANPNFFTGYSNNKKYDFTVTNDVTSNTVVADVSNIDQLYNRTAVKTTNNYLLSALNPDVDCDTITTPPATTSATTTNPLSTSLTDRSNGITYGKIYNNILNYPSDTNTIDKKYYIRTYYLPDGKTTTVTVDMRTSGVIITTLSGDVPGGIPFNKKTTITGLGTSIENIKVEYY